MGVSGVGKTTLGKMLASEMNIPFHDADDFHSAQNIEKMSHGIPLTDEDRADWLQNLKNAIHKWGKDDGAVLACSALKEKYRKFLAENNDQVVWIYLYETYDVILQRLKERKNHYFKPDLLKSQFDTLEKPDYGIHIKVDEQPKNTFNKIMNHLKYPEIGLVGLGVMGKSLALNMASKGIPVSVFNREVKGKEEGVAKDFAENHQDVYDFPWFDDLEKFVKSLPAPRNIFLMVNAGKAVDYVIDEILPFLEEGDLLIDGGNSHYTDTNRRAQYLNDKGILFLGTGVSGGEEGALKGPSIMPGGDKKAYDRIGAALEAISAKDSNGDPCCAFIGPQSSGHFVKMLHNGIEYGEMQLISEFYHLMRFGLKYSPEKISQIYAKWNKEQDSFLLEISVEILKFKENGELILDQILDVAGQKGTGGWSSIAALDLGVSFDTISAAVMARNISADKNMRLEASDIYAHKEHEINISEEELFKAYKAASTINHAVGFELLRAASTEFDWNLNYSEIARIWTNGCIIKSQLMKDLSEMLEDHGSVHILLNTEIAKKVNENKNSLSFVVGKALEAEYPMQVSSAALNYFLGLSSSQSSANMIQAQRDFFGAHTYERKDKSRGEFFHTDWTKTS